MRRILENTMDRLFRGAAAEVGDEGGLWGNEAPKAVAFVQGKKPWAVLSPLYRKMRQGMKIFAHKGNALSENFGTFMHDLGRVALEAMASPLTAFAQQPAMARVAARRPSSPNTSPQGHRQGYTPQ